MSQVFGGSAGFVSALVTGVVVFLIWIASRKRLAAKTVGRAEEQAQRILQEAQREADAQRKEVVLAAKEEAHEVNRQAEEQMRARHTELAALEKQTDEQQRALGERETAIERDEGGLKGRDASLAKQEAKVADQMARYQELVADHTRELTRVSGMTADEAKDVLLRHMENDARHDAANLVKRLEHEARETAADKAKHIIVQAIQRSAPEHAIETTVSVVHLPSDDLKGRIIGREGRNIRALETATGVELIIDDTPGAVILSSFDPYRRAVAKQAIEQLVADGRIHPVRIDEVVERVRAEVDKATLKEGEAAGFELGLHDMHPEIYRMMGTAQVPNQLRPERAFSLQRSRLPRWDHGARARDRRPRLGPRGLRS